MIKDNQKKCDKCGCINNINVKYCSNCGNDLSNKSNSNFKIGCLASSVFMFILFGFNAFLYLLNSLLLWLFSSSFEGSFFVIFIILFKFIKIVSVIGAIVTLILGILDLKNSKK